MNGKHNFFLLFLGFCVSFVYKTFVITNKKYINSKIKPITSKYMVLVNQHKRHKLHFSIVNPPKVGSQLCSIKYNSCKTFFFGAVFKIACFLKMFRYQRGFCVVHSVRVICFWQENWFCVTHKGLKRLQSFSFLSLVSKMLGFYIIESRSL